MKKLIQLINNLFIRFLNLHTYVQLLNFISLIRNSKNTDFEITININSYIYIWIYFFTDTNFLFNFQIERERADLSVQVIQLSERLEEAEGGAESQVSLKTNKIPIIWFILNFDILRFADFLPIKFLIKLEILIILPINILQFEINKKRDTELAKLRKLLEDVHLESEETAHLLRKKHQEVVVDFQDQIDQLSKARARLVN